MAKIDQVNNGDTGLDARTKINAALKDVSKEADGSLSGDGNTGTPLRAQLPNIALDVSNDNTLMVSGKNYAISGGDGATIQRLPAAGGTARVEVYIVLSTDTNTVTIDGNGANIEGASTYVIGAFGSGETFKFFYNIEEGEWKVIQINSGGSVKIINDEVYAGALNLTDKYETHYKEYTQPSNETIPLPSGTFGDGSGFVIPFVSDGVNSLSFASGWNELSNEFNQTTAGYYLIIGFRAGGQWFYTVKLSNASSIPNPLITSGSMAVDNTYIDVNFNTPIYGANDGVSPATLADFDVTFTQGAGQATAWTASSATKTDGNPLTGGETTIRINGSATGTPDGQETLEVTPIDSNSLFNSVGTAMAGTETTGAVNLTDETIPILIAPTLDSLVVDSTTEITANWTNNNTSPLPDSNTLEYDTVITFDNAPQQITGIAAGATSQQITGLDPDTEYFVRVRAVGDGVTKQTSVWSNILSATTDAQVVAMTMQTTSGNATTFDPAITVSSGTANWDYGDGTFEDTNAPSKTYGDSTLKTVQCRLGTIPALTDILSVNIVSDDLGGTLGVSDLTGLNGDFIVATNPNLDIILLPASVVAIPNFVVNSNNLSTLDLSALNITGTIQIYDNPLTTVTERVTAENITVYNSRTTQRTTINLSGYTGASGQIQVHDNPQLTSFVAPVTSGVFFRLRIYSCPLLPSIDLTNMPNIGGEIDFGNDTVLTTFTLPATLTQAFTLINGVNCALDLTSVDNIFAKLNTYFTANTPTADLTVNLNGGTSASPTGGASNTDIVNLQSIFSGAGFTFTFNIN